MEFTVRPLASGDADELFDLVNAIKDEGRYEDVICMGLFL